MSIGSEEAKKDGYRALKIAVDVLAVMSIASVFIVLPIWLNYGQLLGGTLKTLTQMRLMFFSCVVLCGFGLRWFGYRYADILARKYPVTATLWFRMSLALAVPLLMMLIFTVKVVLS